LILIIYHLKFFQANDLRILGFRFSYWSNFTYIYVLVFCNICYNFKLLLQNLYKL